MMKEKDIERLDWDKNNGLIPVIVQDSETLCVLMLGYVNRQALLQTLETGLMTFFSRTRQELWVKGQTSGNFLKVVDIMQDCDGDCLLAKVIPQGSGKTCHLGTTSCFGENSPDIGWIAELARIIEQRKQQASSASYTKKLFDQGVNFVSQKIVEEAGEIAIEAVSRQRERLIEEIADLVYHLLVLGNMMNTEITDITKSLKKRSGKTSSQAAQDA